MQSNKRIVLTGGGSAGHVTPNLAIVSELRKRNFEIFYIGSKNGIEKGIVERHNIPFFSITTGKIKRYMSLSNLSTPLSVIKGIIEAKKILKEQKINIVFSKGGYVAVPVVIAAHQLKIPVISHEADFTPGLANKLATPFSTIVCTNFEETAKMIKNNKGIYTGCPIRSELLNGDINTAKNILNFNNDKPIILILGGSLGSNFINTMIRENLDLLLKDFNIIHSTGIGKLDTSYQTKIDSNTYNYKYNNYKQYELIRDELPHFYKISDLIISRAGANVIFELLSLKKPNLLIPLGLNASRGDQILNANSFKSHGFSEVIFEEEYHKNKQLLFDKLYKLYEDKKYYIKNMQNATLINSNEKICDIIEKYVN